MIPQIPAVFTLGLLLTIPGEPVQAQSAGDSYMPASEAPADTSLWVCAFCPYRYGWYGEIDAGGGWVSDSSNKFGDYRGLADGGGFLALDGEVHYRDKNGLFADVEGFRLGIDSRQAEARGGIRGRYTLALSYQEIPKYRGFGTETVYRGSGGNNLTLPAGWQPAPITTQMSDLSLALQPADLETIRKIFEVGLSWKLDRRWSYEVQYQHQAKEGTRPFGAGLLTINASHLPAPVDFSTDRLETGLNFNGDKSHWRLGFSGSAFKNPLDSFTWENPFTAHTGTELLRASLAPDNSFYQFDMAGAWAPSARLRLSASAAVGRMEQDEPLLPYSINPIFGAVPIPRLTADGKIDVGTTNLAGNLTAQLSRRLVLTARLKRDERDNKTPVDFWTPVTTDFVERDARPNRPYSFERDRASLTLRYRPLSRLRIEAGAEWENYERTLQSVRETEEDGWFAEASFTPATIMEVRVRLAQSLRDGEPYLQVPDYGLPDHPLMRKFNLADRDSDQLRVDVDFYPIPEFMLSIAYRDGRDEYRQSIIGLRESREKSLSLDLSWTPNAAVTAYTFASHDKIDSLQAGAETDLLAPWLASTDDDFMTGGLGFTVRLSPGTDIGFDIVISDADGNINTGLGDTESPFPVLKTELRNTRLRLEHRVTESWGIKFYLENEKYNSSDWALDGYGPDGIPAILTFGADSPDYNVTVVRLQASYRFD